eukprot:SAG11_NODE_27409_length_333_cov_0.658120_1_plen_94_part_01
MHASPPGSFGNRCEATAAQNLPPSTARVVVSQGLIAQLLSGLSQAAEWLGAHMDTNKPTGSSPTAAVLYALGYDDGAGLPWLERAINDGLVRSV